MGAVRSGDICPTVDEVLLLRGPDGRQVASVRPAVLLRLLPGLLVGEVSVAEALELLPACITWS